MQTLRPALALLLLCSLAPATLQALPKPHTVTLGPIRKVPYTPPEAPKDARSEEATTLRVRPLLVDGQQREWTVGELHEVTDRSFTIRRVLHLNDALPGEPARWSWQPGPWLQVDRITGHITALHLPAFDPAVSEAVWFRDYAAYCGITTTAKGGLVAIVAQLNARKPVAERLISKWPLPSSPTAPASQPACAPAKWQRSPMRATLTPTLGDPITFDVVGTSSLIEEGDPDPAP